MFINRSRNKIHVHVLYDIRGMNKYDHIYVSAFAVRMPMSE